MNIARMGHACTVHRGKNWVGGSYLSESSSEVYSIEEDKWRFGPDLPYTAYTPGKFVSYGEDLFYVGGWDRPEIHRLNVAMDGWIFVSIAKLYKLLLAITIS